MAHTTQSALPLDHLLHETHVTFRYRVEIEKVPVGALTECTLTTIEVQVKEVREGGLNSHAHQLPAGVKLTRLILKNGVGKNGMMDWWKEIVDWLPDPIIKDGFIEVWDRPGLGIGLNPDKASQYLSEDDKDFFD